jgi:hypothetical protein
MLNRIASGLMLLALSAFAQAEGSWTLTTADFRAQQVSVNSIDSTGVHISPTTVGGADSVVKFDDFLEVSRPVFSTQSAGKFVLHLAGEDQVGGEPLAIKGNELIWSSPTLGQIAIPMKQLVAMTRPGAALPDTRRREDVVTLGNGDLLRGIIGDVADGKVTVQTDAGPSNVPLGSVTQINFAATAGSSAPANGFRVRFDDGSSIVASSLTLADDKAQLSFGKQAAREIETARIAAVEQVNGPVSWLSSRPAAENVYVPFMGTARTGAARMDRNWTGLDPIRFGARQYAHGIGVHSYSRLSWNLDDKYASFRTQYAIDTKDANTKADVVVRVLLDGKVAYEQAHVRAGTLSAVVALDLKGAKKLTLEIDYGDNMDTQDRLNWIEPALLKKAVR